MDEPPPLEDGSSFGKEGRLKENDIHNLEERFYRYGIKPDWLQINRVLNHRYCFQFEVYIQYFGLLSSNVTVVILNGSFFLMASSTNVLQCGVS